VRIDRRGLLEGAGFIASRNSDERPPGSEVELLVIHSISLPPGEFGGPGIIDLFTSKLDRDAHPYYREIAGLKVSSHFLIRRDGEIIQFVACDRRAWHAGESSWRGRERCNDFSIGIELEGADDVPFEDVQYERLAELTRALNANYQITDIVGHSDIAPGRKTDPGPCFDWVRYRSIIKGD
jgi:N-acetyl-anhydromuramoyl-L-alanine amidase